jgi:phage terminase small subunit
MREYPQARNILAYSRELGRIEQTFGMSPSARVSLAVAPTPSDTEDDAERFFSGGD